MACQDEALFLGFAERDEQRLEFFPAIPASLQVVVEERKLFSRIQTCQYHFYICVKVIEAVVTPDFMRICG
ncbi:MAG: hypothetical protein P1S60_02340 [Anaerolineae bacterium]|nr:hypothetical protein [Anaerolineae bacterium]